MPKFVIFHFKNLSFLDLIINNFGNDHRKKNKPNIIKNKLAPYLPNNSWISVAVKEMSLSPVPLSFK